jgi:hypothetical protein
MVSLLCAPISFEVTAIYILMENDGIILKDNKSRKSYWLSR